MCTSALRPGSPGPSRAITTAGTLQDEGRNPGRQRRTPPSHSILPTVSDHCNPAIQGKTTTSMPPLVYTTPPYAYKRRRWVSFSGGGLISLVWTLVCLASLASLLKRTRKVYRALISTDSTLSRDLGASLPLSPRLYPLLQALRVQDNTVPSHTPFAGRTAPRPEPG